MRASIATLLLSGAVAVLWSVQAPASECDFTTLGGNCSGDSFLSAQSAGNAPLPAPAEAAPLQVASEITLLSVSSEALPLRAPDGGPLSLFEMLPKPDPGSWAMPIIAGLLGMYAVVRRRTISS